MFDNDFGLVITDKTKIKLLGEHKGSYYYVYFDNIPSDLIYFKFRHRWKMEEFLYSNGIERFNYKSSNGNTITKVWKYIPGNLESWQNSRFRTKKEKERGTPEKYTWDDWYCGHYVKE